MAVFLVNGCKFKGCNLIFETLAELIQHVEEAHIDLDPKVLEQQENEHPEAVALSYVLRFYAGAKPKKSLLAISTKKSRQRNNSVMSTSASIRSLTPTSSEYDFEDDPESYHGLDSNLETRGTFTAEQQWTNQLMLSMITNKSEDAEKPYVCKVKGCKKRYKNINGVKYHARHGHKREARLAKFTSKCFCGKSFNTVRQLELHTKTEHSLASLGITSLANYDVDSLVSKSTSTGNIKVKDEPGSSLVATSTPTTTAAVSLSNTSSESKAPLSIIHPITISGSVLLTPPTSQNLKTVKKGEILFTHKVPSSTSSNGNCVTSKPGIMASLVTSSSLVTPPNTPHKRMNLAAVKTEQDEKQQEINEKVARALAAAKQAMEAAAAAKDPSINTSTNRATILTRP